MNTNFSVLVGFDGFVDSIYRVVESRKSPSQYTCMQRMQELSERIIDAHGKSTNLELVLQEERLGGNGPILANALHTLGVQTSLIGALGYPDIEPIFEPLAKACNTCVSIAPSGKTDALEFSNGKLLLGKHTSILSIDEQVIVDKVGKNKLHMLLESCDIFASTNWTMLFGMTKLWQYLETEILPRLSKKPKWMFVDIADPAKRLDSDLIEAMNTLSRLHKQIKVVLG
ncbi:MAG: hypothetical protein LLF94_08870, partial [Chlamydiales bacterium]|nr:hypothetical protein [Chlamydiales bacterium]